MREFLSWWNVIVLDAETHVGEGLLPGFAVGGGVYQLESVLTLSLSLSLSLALLLLLLQVHTLWLVQLFVVQYLVLKVAVVILLEL